MRASLRDEDVRARFLDHYARHGVLVRAAQDTNVTINAVAKRRRRDPVFADAVAARRPDRRPRTQGGYVRMTAARRDAFLAAFAETGNAAAAARDTGVAYNTIWYLRAHDDAFAAAWADAHNQAAARVEDALFDAVLNGFIRTETVDGVERVVRTQNAPAMFKLLERAAKSGRSRYRTVELTPDVVAAARARVDTYVRLAAEARLVETAALPPPTESAS